MIKFSFCLHDTLQIEEKIPEAIRLTAPILRAIRLPMVNRATLKMAFPFGERTGANNGSLRQYSLQAAFPLLKRISFIMALDGLAQTSDIFRLLDDDTLGYLDPFTFNELATK